MFGAFGVARQESRVTFVSEVAAAAIAERLGLRSPVLPVRGIRSIGKKDMILNDATPVMSVDPETCEVRADGRLLTCEPAAELALAQRYFLF